ncbi:MAG: SH3 domain-containing protein [Lachnospiraceae bacterium]|nr:SH3 domain-containing protein [Lachnospiraceae bacterium]
MKKGLGGIVCALIILCVMGESVCAAAAEDEKKANTVWQTTSDVELHESPDAASAVTDVLSGGTPVMLREDEKEGWCLVMYQDITGYLQSGSLELLGSQTGLDSEFQDIKEAGRLSFQEAEAVKERIEAERIWGAVIVVLVTAIFGVGILSALKRNKSV